MTRAIVYILKLLLIKSTGLLGFMNEERLQFYGHELPVLIFVAQFLAEQIKIRVPPPAKNDQHG